MSKSQRKQSKSQTNLSAFEKFKRVMLSIGIVGIIGLIADLLGLVSFFGTDDGKIENQNNIYNRDNSISITNYNDTTINQTNFNNKSIFNNQVINQSIINNANTSEIESDAQNDILQAINLYNSDQLDLALMFINKHSLPPSGIDPTFFYTLKGNILFFNAKYDDSFNCHLLAYNINKHSKYLEVNKLKALVMAYAQLKTNGYSLKDLKSINVTKQIVTYDLGIKKLQIANGNDFIVLDKTNDSTIFRLLRELKLERPEMILRN